MNLLVIMSHQLSDIQIKDAKREYGIDKFKVLPQELQKIWSNVDSIGDLNIGSLKPIKCWIQKESKENDYVLIQGEFGATFYIVDYCFNINRVPIYATSKRQVEEKVKGDETITSRHVNFRRYIRYQSMSDTNI